MKVCRFRDRFSVVSDAVHDSDLSDGAYRMLCLLCEYVNHGDGWVRNVPVSDLVATLDKSEHTVGNRLGELHDRGYIERRLLGNGHHAAYRILCLTEGWLSLIHI